MNNSAASSGVSDRDKTFHGVTPDFLIGGPIPNSSGFPLKAWGNDGALAVVEMRQDGGMSPKDFKRFIKIRSC